MDGAREIGIGRQPARGAQQHGGVPVMAAGVHLAGMDRFMPERVFLFERKRVHVGAQTDNLAGLALAPVDDANHAGAAKAGHDLVTAKFLELVGDHAGRALHVVQDFGMGMQIVPPGGDLAMQVGDAVDDRHVQVPREAAV